MKTRTIIIVMAMLLSNFLTNAQENKAVGITKKGLQIGQQVPNFSMITLLNSEDKTLSLSSLKGKIVILDFWSTWCGPCVRAMPKLNSLQHEFKNDLQILLVTKDSANRVSKFFNLNNYAKGVKLPVIGLNETTSALFPFTHMPHLVWINKQGDVLAITDTEALNRENIKDIIAQKPVVFILKDDYKPKTKVDNKN